MLHGIALLQVRASQCEAQQAQRVSVRGGARPQADAFLQPSTLRPFDDPAVRILSTTIRPSLRPHWRGTPGPWYEQAGPRRRGYESARSAPGCARRLSNGLAWATCCSSSVTLALCSCRGGSESGDPWGNCLRPWSCQVLSDPLRCPFSNLGSAHPQPLICSAGTSPTQPLFTPLLPGILLP